MNVVRLSRQIPFFDCRRFNAHFHVSSGSLVEMPQQLLKRGFSIVYGMYPETYLLCQLTSAREARRLCSTSTECTRYITHLSLETDVSAHTERRECAESVRGVQNTTTRAARTRRWICTEVDRFDIELTGRLVW
ncbi:hypothetical protein EDD85DRAFT_942626 [Armillaria nabsnona]|nr:hypothetical protein EDD85DRAFT_942626 [Armillaria nabsnona]